MNVLSIKQNNCRKFQSYLDSYLNNELLVETTHEVIRHLEGCPNCFAALRERQRVKDLLKSAVLKDTAPMGLQEKIRKSIRQAPSTDWTRLMFLAAAMIAFIAVVGGALQFLNRSTPTRSDTVSLAMDANTQLLKIGLDDHVQCALAMGFANRVFTEEEMRKTLGAEFGGLVTAVKQKAPENYRLVVGHHCKANGREFVHLILKSPQTALSLVMTKKDSESFTRDDLAAVLESSGAPIYEARLKDLEVAGFETRDYFGFVISNLGRSDHLQMALTLAPTVREFLTKEKV